MTTFLLAFMLATCAIGLAYALPLLGIMMAITLTIALRKGFFR